MTYTQTGTTGTLYEDGVQVGQNTSVTVLPSQIGAGTTTNNVLGESNYASDNTLKGKVRGFRIYDRALTADRGRRHLAHRHQPPRRRQGRPDAGRHLRGHRGPDTAHHRRLRLRASPGRRATRPWSAPPAR